MPDSARHDVSKRKLAAALAMLCCAAVLAQPGPVSDTPAELPDIPPIILPERALKGIALLRALRAGGFVLYMRHALTAPTDDECSSNGLSAEGEAQARLVGQAIRDLRIPVSAVLASPVCRGRDTARLLDLAAVEVTPALDRVGGGRGIAVHAQRRALLAQPPAPGTNVLLVSHLHSGGPRADWLHVAIAEVAVYQPDGQGASHPVARITVDQWAGLLALPPDPDQPAR